MCTALGKTLYRSSGWVLLGLFITGGICQDPLPVRRAPTNQNIPLSIPANQLNEAFAQANIDLQGRIQIEQNLQPSETLSPLITSADTRLQNFGAFNNNTGQIDRIGQLFISASRELRNRLSLTGNDVLTGLNNVDLTSGNFTDILSSCRESFQTQTCDPSSQYRTADGSCNNLNNPNWGQSLTCFSRLLPPNYGDALSSPRAALSGATLPNARLISEQVHETARPRLGNWTIMVMQFGQFLNHDITFSLMTRTILDSTMLECCPAGSNPHPECFPIEIPSVPDDFFRQQNQTCMSFVRSATCARNCQLGPREQSNRVTSYIDASTIYGNDVRQIAQLRTNTGGLLTTQDTAFGEFPPNSFTPATDQCSINEANTCFETGDWRANQHPSLTAMQILFFRLHNTAARAIQASNRAATDEELFQRARRVVVAIIQNIAYNNYLSVVLGAPYMNYFNLIPGQRSAYSLDTDASILDEFATAAHRYGHTLIPESVLTGPGSNVSVPLSQSFAQPFALRNGALDPVLAVLGYQQDKRFDRFLVQSATRMLYIRPGQPFGLDLAAINIQRGRDHGTPGYVQYINYCFDRTITRFEDLASFMTTENWQRLQRVYNNVEDIDFFTGGVSESPLAGGVVGPTFGCVIGTQFNRLKFGDRFYFEHADQVGSFNDAQLAEIRSSSIAQIMCRNLATIQGVNRNPFLLQSPENRLLSCSDIPDFNYSLF